MNKVELSGVNTSKLKVLPKKEMDVLLEKSAKGDKTARNEIVNGNLKLVLSVIQRFLNRGENADDLFQVGCVGLIKAIDNFDTGHNVKFSTYAVPMIIGEIRRYLRDNNSIRVSRSVRDLAYKALQAKELLSSTKQQDPTVEEIAKEINVPVEDVVLALDAILDPISLNEPIYSDGSDPIYVMDHIKDIRNNDENWVEEIALKEAMKRLNDREKYILSLRFFVGRTQTEVAEDVGISQAQVSRLEKNALDKIKKHV